MFPEDTAYTITIPPATSPSPTPPETPQTARTHNRSPTRHGAAPHSAVSFTEYVTSEFVLNDESPRFTLSFKPPPNSLPPPADAISVAAPPSTAATTHHADVLDSLQTGSALAKVARGDNEKPLHRSETLPNMTSEYGLEEGSDGDNLSSSDINEVRKESMEAHAPSRSRCSRLDILEIDCDGEVRELSLTRAEILQKARSKTDERIAWPSTMDGMLSSEGVDNNQPQWSDLPLREGIPAGSPRLDSRRRAVQKALRDYLRNSLQARDIRQVDPAFVAKPALWVRHSAIVVSLEGMRAIILYDRLLLFDPLRNETKQLLNVAQKCIMSMPDADNPQTFEFNALEGILIFVAMRLEREFDTLKPQIDKYLHHLPNELTTKMLEELRRKKQQLNHFHSRACNVKTILENLLDEDDEMANMYLTEKHEQGRMIRDCHDHSEVETLLEAYLQVIEEHVNHASLLHDAIEDTEDLVMIHLDTLRNRLLSVELTLSVVSMMFGAGGVIAGAFGMNLQMPLFEQDASTLWFLFVVVMIVLIVGAVSWLVLISLRRRGLYSVN